MIGFMHCTGMVAGRSAKTFMEGERGSRSYRGVVADALFLSDLDVYQLREQYPMGVDWFSVPRPLRRPGSSAAALKEVRGVARGNNGGLDL